MNDLYGNNDSDGEKALDLNYLLTTSQLKTSPPVENKKQLYTFEDDPMIKLDKDSDDEKMNVLEAELLNQKKTLYHLQKSKTTVIPDSNMRIEGPNLNLEEKDPLE